MDNLKYRHPERARLAATRLSRREHIAAAQDQRHRHVGGAGAFHFIINVHTYVFNAFMMRHTLDEEEAPTLPPASTDCVCVVYRCVL